MLNKFRLWRWLRIKRVKARRVVELELRGFSRLNERITGDNFPVLGRV